MNISNAYEFVTALEVIDGDFNGSFTTEELVVGVPVRQIARSVDVGWRRWRRLDREKLLRPVPLSISKVIGGTSQVVAVPRGMNYLAPWLQLNVDRLSHARIPEAQKMEYMTEVSGIFQSIPRFRALTSAIDGCGLECGNLKDAFEKEKPLAEVVGQWKGLERCSGVQRSGDGEVFTSITITSPHGVKQQELELSETTTLRQLAQSLVCVHVSKQPPQNDFFFIGGIFYVGDGDAASKRILSRLQEEEENGPGRAKRRKTNSGTKKRLLTLGMNNADDMPTVLSLANVCLRDVGLKLGSRFLYCHDDFCEHVWTVSDIRLTHPLLDSHCQKQDEQHHHPRTSFISRNKRRACEVCLAWGAEHVTLEDRLVPDPVCFFCRHCFHMLHYSLVDGCSIYEFTSHKYSRDA